LHQRATVMALRPPSSPGMPAEELRGTFPSTSPGAVVASKELGMTVGDYLCYERKSSVAVVASKELGMTVGGQGAGSPERSLEVLERQVHTLLPELRAAYESERAQDPALMGSLDVNMVIEPNGGVSDLRFPVKRVSNDRLTSTVFNQMRAWTFPPAELPAQLRLTLLFVPPGMDYTSILLWERRLGSRPIMEKFDEPSPPLVEAATSPLGQEAEGEALPEKGEEASTQTHAKATVAEKDAVSVPEAQARKKKNARPSELTGWYQVLYPTPLRSSPQALAQVIARLQGGTRVRVVSVVKGQWLEVRSVSDRPTGFLWWEDAIPERTEQAGGNSPKDRPQGVGVMPGPKKETRRE